MLYWFYLIIGSLQANNEKMQQICFETFNHPAYYRALSVHWHHTLSKNLTCNTAAIVSLCKRACGNWSECRLWWRGDFNFIRLWGIRHSTLYQREIYFLTSSTLSVLCVSLSSLFRVMLSFGETLGEGMWMSSSSLHWNQVEKAFWGRDPPIKVYSSWVFFLSFTSIICEYNYSFLF